MRCGLLHLVCFWFLTGTLYAQTFTRFGFLEGLENENIVHVNQDENGNLWLATLGGGVSRFNGLEFRNYTVRKGLAHNFVMNVFCGQKEVFAITDLGISVLQGEKFTSNYHHQITTSVMIDEAIFFKNENGKLGELRNAIVYSIPFPDESEVVHAITLLSDVVLVLSKSNILYELDDDRRLVALHDFNKAVEFTYRGKIIWIGKGLDFQKHNIVIADKESIPPQLNKSGIRQILIESAARTWVIHDGQLYLRTDEKLTRFSNKEGFTNAKVNYLFKDIEGDIWVATEDGLFKVQFSEFVLAGSVDLHDKISTITSLGRNHLLIGTQNGKLFELKNKVLSRSTWTLPASVHSYTSLFFDSLKKSLWVGTGEDGLYRISGKERSARIGEAKILSEGVIRHILRGSNGNTWIGTQQGLVEIDNDDSTNVYQATSGLSDNVIWGIREDRHGTIINLTRKGVDFIANGRVMTDTSFQDLVTRRITCFIVDTNGNFWVGTLGFGLLFIDGITKEIKEITTDDGLNSDLIVNLIQVHEDIYVGTFKGIDVVSSSKDRPVIRHLSEEIIPTNFHSFYFDSKSNELWFGSNENCYVYKFTPGQNHPPLINLQKSIIDGPSGETVLENVANDIGTLMYNENNIKFEFLGLCLSNPQAVTYSTRLIGWDSTWTKPFKGRTSSFTNLPPGKYKFEVVAYNHNGLKSEAAAFINFTIDKPIWMEAWFIACMILFLITSGIGIYKYRLNRKLAIIMETERSKQEVLEKVRKTIARDFHDNMGNKLAGIKLYTNLVALKLKNVNTEVSELLAFIEKNSQELFEGTKDFIWSIDPESDNLVEVYTYIKDFGEEFFKRTNIEFYSNMTLSNGSTKIPSGWSRQIVLIFKEAMTNTIKHSKGSAALFQMEIKDNKFVFKYSDNGQGLTDFHPQGKGLGNMKARAEGITCDLVFGKNPDNELEIKLSGTFV